LCRTIELEDGRFRLSRNCPYVGHAAIDTWWRDVNAKYQAVAEPLEVNAQGDAHQVRAKVTGQFPGSPITLTFAFRLKDDRIAALEIGP
jgi:hypothetical protein